MNNEIRKRYWLVTMLTGIGYLWIGYLSKDYLNIQQFLGANIIVLIVWIGYIFLLKRMLKDGQR